MTTEEELIKTVTVEDFKKLKEEMYKTNFNNENALTRLKTLLEVQLDKKERTFNTTFETIENKLSNFHDILISDKNKIDKIPELIEFKLNSHEDIFTLNIKVSNLQKDLSLFINKYDNIFLENLELPGIIGLNCQYPNLREYLNVRIF